MLQEGKTQQSKDKALFKTLVTCSQAWARRLHSKSASHIRLILSARIRAFCILSLVGSWLLRVAAVISIRFSSSLAIPKIMRSLGVHFTNCVISCRILAVPSGVRQYAVQLTLLSSRPCFSGVSLSLVVAVSVCHDLCLFSLNAFCAKHRRDLELFVGLSVGMVRRDGRDSRAAKRRKLNVRRANGIST